MSTPQNGPRRLKQKARRAKQLDRWRKKKASTDASRKVIDTVAFLQEYSKRVRAVQSAYAKVKGQGVGLCHEMAVAIIEELAQRKAADGWTWCSGKVDDDVDHSWVEYGEWRVDMNERGILRFTKPGDSGAFNVVGKVTRRDAARTTAWADEEERKVKGVPGSGRERNKTKK